MLGVYKDGSPWMWAADAPEEDDNWIFQEDGPEFSQQTAEVSMFYCERVGMSRSTSLHPECLAMLAIPGYVRDAPSFDTQPPREGTVTKKSTGEKFQAARPS